MKLLTTCALVLGLTSPALAGESEAADLAACRLATMKAHLESFQLTLTYQGPSDKPFYNLLLAVAPLERTAESPFAPQATIPRSQALALLGQLEKSGFFHRAITSAPTLPNQGYVLRVQAGETHFTEVLGWDPTLLRKLEGLRGPLTGDARQSFDRLIARLSGLRQQWETAADVSSRFKVTMLRNDTPLRFVAEGPATVIHIASASGIGGVTLQRESKEWPYPLLVRMHLSGLESFKVSSAEATVQWWASSEGKSYAALWQGNQETELTSASEYYTPVETVGGRSPLPLKEGYFEIPLPRKLFAGNPQEIRVEWIDFYRN